MSTFMCQKSFHPASKANQKRRFVAEQREEQKKKDSEIRRKQLELEQKQLETGGKSSEISFMYKPPPGYAAVKEAEKKAEDMQGPAPPDEPGYLKNAPTEGAYTKEMNVTHKPFGMENRKVRCIRCGIRGHQSGDRECKLRFQNPNDKKEKDAEDPISLMASNSDSRPQGNILMKEELSQIHHGPAHLRGKYDLVGSDDEGDINAEDLVAELSTKQRRKLLKFMKKQKKEQKKKDKKLAKKKKREEKWVEKEYPNDDSSRRRDYREESPRRTSYRDESPRRREYREERRRDYRDSSPRRDRRDFKSSHYQRDDDRYHRSSRYSPSNIRHY